MLKCFAWGIMSPCISFVPCQAVMLLKNQAAKTQVKAFIRKFPKQYVGLILMRNGLLPGVSAFAAFDLCF